MGSELAEVLSSCSLDLIPVYEPGAVQHGSLIRAQIAGAIPVSSRHLGSVLPLSCGRWDLGPPPSNRSVADDSRLLKVTLPH